MALVEKNNEQLAFEALCEELNDALRSPFSRVVNGWADSGENAKLCFHAVVEVMANLTASIINSIEFEVVGDSNVEEIVAANFCKSLSRRIERERPN